MRLEETEERKKKKKNGSATKRKKKGSTKQTNGSASEHVAEVAERDQKRKDCISRLNTKHAVVRLGGDTVILLEEPGEPPQFLTAQALHLWYQNDRIWNGHAMVPVSREWLKSEERRQYEHVVFDPTDKNPKHYNMWRGFAVKPDASKSCDKFLGHIRDIMCSGNDDHYRWVIGFLAHMVQRPEEKPGVALALRGGEGTGKGFFANVIGRLCPHHYIVISQAAHLTGRFNAHQQQVLLMFIDEGFWAGDKQGEGTLKHLITDPELLVEPKRINAFMVRNLSRLIVASNEHWAVPAGLRARRWCVLDVADVRANDRAYFGAIDAELKAGGLEAFMHLLMTFDLTSVDVYDVPKTAALLEQKEESMPPHVRWWMQCLQLGELQYHEEGFTVEGDDEWPEETQKDHLWQSYQLYMKEHNIRARLWPSQQLHRWLKPLLPGSQEGRDWKGKRKRRIVLPTLDACREAYAKHLGQTINWE
jgi:hypothetical protein